jgi:hypothetical protein
MGAPPACPAPPHPAMAPYGALDVEKEGEGDSLVFHE